MGRWMAPFFLGIVVGEVIAYSLPLKRPEELLAVCLVFLFTGFVAWVTQR